MTGAKEQLQILREIFTEDFDAKNAGTRGGSFTTLFEVTSIEGRHLPEGISVQINFDNSRKPLLGGYSSNGDIRGRVDERFKGNLNVFVMKKKKVLKNVHVTYNQETFEKRMNQYSLRKIINEALYGE